ncbi:DNA helicase-2; ATP-dependent DNA helicase PcrA [Candidatus Electrothrix aarhusensis]|uniref:DNA helicase-2 n=1 Tax=Candidatus Electrothrix aarhusensis TaxID=1859131 RepID=A0A3S3QX33_9BACT|nr:DNA helicase-2; ATP-dependent DNA helicase PcrA [Candidatus Electrothrix aarhusensis]
METHEEFFHTIAAKVCNKPKKISAEDCFSQTSNSLCRDHRKCRLHEKTLEQLKYVHQPAIENTFLRACPGSGKTEAVGLKAAHEIKSWPHSSKGIAVLTFTNNAANEIAERIIQFAGVNGTVYPHFVGTIDGWLHGYVANPFAHLWTEFPGKDGDRSLRIIETGYQADWLNSFKAPTLYPSGAGKFTPIYANNYYLDAETDLFYIRPLGGRQWIAHTTLYNSAQFTKFRSDKAWLTTEKFYEGFRDTKLKFWKAGFCTYQDIESLTYWILDGNKNDVTIMLSKRFPLVIIDECQDLSWVQLSILKKLQEQGSALHFIGDLNQAIYSFKKVSPYKVKKFADNNSFTEMLLNENFRSTQPIVDLCGTLCTQGTIAGCQKNKEDSQPSCVLFTYSPDRLSDLPQQFSDYLTTNALDVSKSAILARGKTLIGKLRAGINENFLKNGELPVQAILLWNTGDWDRQKTALQHMGKYIATTYFSKNSLDSRNQHCPEAITSKIQWRAFLAALLKACGQNSDLVDHDMLWSNWSKKFREHFPKIISKTAERQEFRLSSITFKYQCPRGKANIRLMDDINGVSEEQEASNIRITTIHQVKGETHDATLLVSSPDKRGGKGGHWSEWLDDSAVEGEHARFAYVASSRPKYLLAWAIPESNKEGIAKLQKLGFKPI